MNTLLRSYPVALTGRWTSACLTAVLLAAVVLPADAQPGINPNLAPDSVWQDVPPADFPPTPVMEPEPAVFRGGAGVPTVTGVVPTRNRRNAPRTSPMTVTFSEGMSTASATRGALHLFSAQRGGRLAGAATVSGHTLTFGPATGFRAGETVSATLTTAAQSTTGHALGQPQVFQFTTAVDGGTGNLSELAATPRVMASLNPFNLALGDLDGDGDLDMALPHVGIGAPFVGIRLNTGLNSTQFAEPASSTQVTVTSPPRTVVLGDIDGDGDLDLVATQNFAGNTVSVRLNNGLHSAQFVPPAVNPEVAVGRHPLNAALGDVDGDGDLDLLVVNNQDNTVSIRLNSGLNSGHFVAPATSPEVSVGLFPLGIALGDVDGDGDLDLLTTAYQSNGLGTLVSVRLNSGVNTGRFVAPAVAPEVTVGRGPVLVALGDVDGDGDLDLVTNDYTDNTASIRLNSGLNSGHFVTPATPTQAQVSVGARPESVVLGDIDADGDLDLLTANFNGNTVSVRLNNGSGIFSAPAANAEIAVGTQPSGLALGDLDNDGDLDFVTGNYGDHSASVRLNQGPDLVVSTARNVTGTYTNVTVTGTGVATVTGPLTVTGTLAVLAGGTLKLACQPLTGAGNFTLAAGATLGICDPAGIATTGPTGAVQVAGLRSFSPEASYHYYGTTAQVTGSGLPAQVRNLTTTNAHPLTLTAPTSVTQVLTVGGAGNLVLNGHLLRLLSGSAGTALLVNSGPGLVTGATGAMQRAIDGSSNPDGTGDHYFSAPVAGSTVAGLATAGFTPSVHSGYNTAAIPLAFNPFPNVFGYNQHRLTNTATGITLFDKGFESPASLGEALAVGKGYRVHLADTAIIHFQGTFNQGPQLIGGLTRLGPTPAAAPADQAGWHLVGNPYPSPLDWGTVAEANHPNVDAAVYVYQSTSSTGGVYKSFVNDAGAGTRVLAAGQGFLVRVSAAGATGSISLTNSNRLTSFVGQPVFQRSVTTRPQVQLTLRNSAATLSDDVYVYAEAGATAAFDSRFDAYKLPNTTGLNVAALASNAEPLSVQGLPPLTAAEVVVPLHLTVPTTGTYTLHATHVANLPVGTYALLRDAQTGTVLNLAQQPTASFTLSATTASARFSLVFTRNAVLATAPVALPHQVVVYPNPAHTTATIELPAALRQHPTTVTLLNPLGQQVRTLMLPANSSPEARTVPLTGLTPGVYLVRLTTCQGMVMKRLAIK